MNLQMLREAGFDQSSHYPFTKTYRVSCSQCEAMVINGIPCHETGCWNIVPEQGEDDTDAE